MSFTDHDSDLTETEETSDPKDAVFSLLVTPQGHPVTKRLRARDSNGTIVGELAKLVTRFGTGHIEIAVFRPLAGAIVHQSSSVEIWKQVLLLVTAISRLTSPPSVNASFDDKPRTRNSASHRGSEQTKRLLHDALRDELHDCTHIKDAGFFEKHLNDRSWTK